MLRNRETDHLSFLISEYLVQTKKKCFASSCVIQFGNWDLIWLAA